MPNKCYVKETTTLLIHYYVTFLTPELKTCLNLVDIYQNTLSETYFRDEDFHRSSH